MSAPAILDLGCGNDKLEGAVGMDVNPRSAADVIHDLDELPWPFDDHSFEHVRAIDVFEHVKDFVASMEELHRVCTPDATVHIRMPFMTSVHFATDPTHRRAATSRSFDYFDESKHLARYGYSTARFEVLSVEYSRGYLRSFVGNVFRVLDRAVVPMAQRNADIYEHFFAGLYPMHNIDFRLRVHK